MTSTDLEARSPTEDRRMLNLDELEALLAKATPGEWEAFGSSYEHADGSLEPEGEIQNVRVKGSNATISFPSSDGAIASLNDMEYIENWNAENDARCIAALRNDAPAMIAELRELRKVRDAMVNETRALKAKLAEVIEAATMSERISYTCSECGEEMIGPGGPDVVGGALALAEERRVVLGAIAEHARAIRETHAKWYGFDSYEGKLADIDEHARAIAELCGKAET